MADKQNPIGIPPTMRLGYTPRLLKPNFEHRLPAGLLEPEEPRRKRTTEEVSAETPQELKSPRTPDIEWGQLSLPLITIPPRLPPTETSKNKSDDDVLSSLASIMEYVSS